MWSNPETGAAICLLAGLIIQRNGPRDLVLFTEEAQRLGFSTVRYERMPRRPASTPGGGATRLVVQALQSKHLVRLLLRI